MTKLTSVVCMPVASMPVTDMDFMCTLLLVFKMILYKDANMSKTRVNQNQDVLKKGQPKNNKNKPVCTQILRCD